MKMQEKYFTATGFTSLLLWIAGMFVGTLAAAGDLTFVGDFEHGDLLLDAAVNPASPWVRSGNLSEVVSKASGEPVRAGQFSKKSVLNRYDTNISPIVSYRTEVVPANVPDVNFGEDSWYGFSIYFPDDWVEDNVWEIFAQWHGRPDLNLGEDYRNPVMAFQSNGAGLKITNIWDSKQITPPPGTPNRYDGGTTLWEGDVHKGEWTDWVFHVNWSYESDGLTEIWENGQQVASRQGPNTFNDARTPFFKTGIYKGWRLTPEEGGPVGIVSERTVYHDEVRFAGPGGSYSTVAPGQTAPDLSTQGIAIFYDSFESPNVEGGDFNVEPTGWVEGGFSNQGTNNELSIDANFTTPFGEQAAWVNTTATLTSTPSILSEILTADTTYALTFNVARRSNLAHLSNGYLVELLAGSTVLESVSGTALSSDMSQTDFFVFKPDASHAGLLGETLAIRLAGSTQPQFDNLRLAILGLEGDYNDDGIVDAADYTVWLDNIGAPAGTLLNDLTGSVIGQGQYDAWKANFGNTATGSGLAEKENAVPEPTAIFLLGISGILCRLSWRTKFGEQTAV